MVAFLFLLGNAAELLLWLLFVVYQTTLLAHKETS